MRTIILVIAAFFSLSSFGNTLPSEKPSRNETPPAALLRMWEQPGLQLKKQMNLWQIDKTKKSATEDADSSVQVAGKKPSEVPGQAEKEALEKMRDLLKANPNLTPRELLDRMRGSGGSAEIQAEESAETSS